MSSNRLPRHWQPKPPACTYDTGQDACCSAQGRADASAEQAYAATDTGP